MNILKSNKIIGLETLQNLGVNVPKFIVIPDFSDLEVDYCALNYKYTISIINDLIEDKLNELGINDYGYSLRSASFDEDEIHKSAAGRYLSFNGLKTREEIYQAAIAIWKNHRSLTSSGIKCPLILQKTHNSYFSGVLFRELKEDKEVIFIESYYGSCRTIVSGMGTPYRSEFVKNNWTHNFSPEKEGFHRFYSHKSLFRGDTNLLPAGSLLTPEVQPFPKNVRKYIDTYQDELEVYGYRISQPPDWYFDKIINELVTLARNIDNGSGVDIEWGSDLEGKLYYYQYRPLSRSIIFDTDDLKELQKSEDLYLDSNITYLRGLPGSPGIIQGIISKTPSDQSTILMLAQATVEDIYLIESSAGVVSAMGGMLSHLAIVCRELNKPCVLGINTMIPENTLVEINGHNGIVQILS